MGNTDSRLGALYRDHVFKLARAEAAADGATATADEAAKGGILLFHGELDESQLLAAYLNRESQQRLGDGFFNQFYEDFISAGNSLTMELLNSKVSPPELQYIVGANRGNFANLVRFVSLKILFIANAGRESLATEELESQLVQLLVCVRILTKIIPWYLGETAGKKHRRAVDIFWSRDGDHIFGVPLAQKTDLPPLGLLLVRSLVRLLFVEGFTIGVRTSPGSLTHFLWENGIGTQDFTYHHQSPRIDSNRLEILNLLLALCSSDLYQASDFISEGRHAINKFLFCLTSLTPEYELICLVASLINLVCRFCSKHEDETTVPYQDLGYKQNHQQHLPHLRAFLVLSSLQMLNLMCFNSWKRSETFEFTLSLKLQSSNDVEDPLPNICLLYLSTFNREFDLKLILTSFAKTFKMPIELAIEQESNPLNFLSKRPPSSGLINTHYGNGDSANAGNHAGTEGGNESNDVALPPVSPLLLQWLVFVTKLIQTNKCFENYVADKLACKIIIFSVYYISFYQDNPDVSPALIPLCSNLAMLLSSRKLVLAKMLDRLTPNYYTNKIPNFFKISNANINNITYRDFTLIHLCHLAIGDARDNTQPRPWLFELIYNLLPIPSNLKDEDLIQLSSKRQSKALRHGGLSYNASMTLLQLISKMSNKKYLSSFATNSSAAGSFIASPGFKLDLLTLLMRAIIVYIVLYYDEALNLIFVICRHQRVFLQLRETVDIISKALQGNGIIEGVGKVQLQDYLEYALNPRLLQDSLESANRGLSNNSSSEEFNSQNIIFTKAVPQDDDSEDLESNEGNESDEDENSTIKMKKDQELDQEGLGLAKVQSGIKNTEIYEQADLTDYSTLTNKTLFKASRPQWPVGITSKTKAKASATLPLSTAWIGAEPLQTIIRMIRIILHNSPDIATITTSDYYRLMDEIAVFKDKFKNVVQKSLPVVVREMNEAKPLRIDLTERNFVYQEWLHTMIWSDIFNSHSAPYSVSQPNGISAGLNGQNLIRESAIEPISPTMPKLERWNSNGSTISRTNSNGSSLLSYFANQNHEVTPNSPLELTNNHHSSNPPLNSARNKSMPSNSGHSFFRFSWAGFSKSEEYSPIREEEYCDGKNHAANNSRRTPFNLDTGILKPNIWAGTQIRLFKTRRQEKEEFSFLDMTSSLFRRLRFGSTTSVNSLDTINTNQNNHTTNSNNLTPVSSRPWTPRDSLTSNNSMFSTPKQL